MLRLNIMGCGRAGGTVASALSATGMVQIGQVLNPTMASSEKAVSLLGSGQAISTVSEFVSADVWMISTPDGAIADACRELVTEGPSVNGAIVLHLSGRFGPEVLESARAQGAGIAAIHPVRSMPSLCVDSSAFSGTLCIVEGTPAALRILEKPFGRVGAGWHVVHDLDRGLYHAALAIVSNVTKGVVWKAQNWLETAGLDANTAAQASHSLLSITVEDVFREGVRHSITGPVVRGDTSTVEAHLKALEKAGQHDVDVYRVLARTVLDLANERGDLDDEVLQQFNALFALDRT